LGDITTAELRGELDELRHEFERRFKELDERLSTRLDAAEQKHALDNDILQEQLTRIAADLSAMPARIGDLESLQRANHMAQVHLWGVTARYMKLPEAKVQAAERKAEKALRVRRG